MDDLHSAPGRSGASRTATPATLDRLAVVMPAFNESDGLADFLRDIDAHVAPLARSVVYVVVDDASDPPLDSVIRFVGPSLRGEVELLHHDTNRGHGPSALDAYRRGLALLPDLVVHLDGDGQILGSDAARLVQALLCSPTQHVAHAVRRCRTDPWFRRVISSAVGSVLSWGRGDVVDANTPFRAYRPVLLRELLAHTPGDALVPHIHFTLLEDRLGQAPARVAVEHRSRRGDDSTGTTWQGLASKVHLPSWRLLRFCGRAAARWWRPARPGSP